MAKPLQTWHLLPLTHWGRATHISVGNLTIIGSDNGLSPGLHQAIIWTNDGILLIRPLGKNFSEISIQILTFSFKKMRLKLVSAKWWPFCLGLNVLTETLLSHSSWHLNISSYTLWYVVSTCNLLHFHFYNIFNNTLPLLLIIIIRRRTRMIRIIKKQSN